MKLETTMGTREETLKTSIEIEKRLVHVTAVEKFENFVDYFIREIFEVCREQSVRQTKTHANEFSVLAPFLVVGY